MHPYGQEDERLVHLHNIMHRSSKFRGAGPECATSYEHAQLSSTQLSLLVYQAHKATNDLNLCTQLYNAHEVEDGWW